MPPSIAALARLWRPPRWMLDPAALRPGDLILSTQKAVFSLFIRMGTWSPYSHVAIALGNGLFAEAVGMGVRRRSVNTIVKPRLRVRRLDAARHPDAAAIADRAALEVERCMHQEYWISGAMRALFLRTPPDERGRMFCSHLAAHVYREAAGIALVRGKAPENTTPGALGRSPVLRTVDAAVYRPALVPDYLLGADFETLADRETVAVQATLARARAWAESQGLPRPAGWIALQTLLADLQPAQRQQELDGLLAQWLVDDGYFRLIGEAQREALAPLEQIVDSHDGHAGDEPAARMEYFLMHHGRAALAQQCTDETDNAAFYRELLAATPLQTFDLMAWRSEANAAVAARAVEAIDAILAALDARHGFSAAAGNGLSA